MKARAIKLFRDKAEDVVRKKGDIFSISRERFEELNSTQFGVLVEETKNETNEKTVREADEVKKLEDGAIDHIAFKKMNKESLVKYAKEVKNIELEMTMTRTEMIEKLGD